MLKFIPLFKHSCEYSLFQIYAHNQNGQHAQKNKIFEHDTIIFLKMSIHIFENNANW